METVSAGSTERATGISCVMSSLHWLFGENSKVVTTLSRYDPQSLRPSVVTTLSRYDPQLEALAAAVIVQY